MKERLNLTVDGVLLEAMKAYAASKEMSVSELVESYFRSVTRPVRGDSILDLLDRLERPGRDVEAAVGKAGGGAVGAGDAADHPAYADGALKQGGGRHGF
jgi:Family of unknown function (DUF6364)